MDIAGVVIVDVGVVALVDVAVGCSRGLAAFMVNVAVLAIGIAKPVEVAVSVAVDFAVGVAVDGREWLPNMRCIQLRWWT